MKPDQLQPLTQIIFVHGGNVFATNEEFYTSLRDWTYDPYAPARKHWRTSLMEETVVTHDFLFLEMPNKQNADYIAWSIWFEKVIPVIRDGAVLIGHSLGGGFYLRYLTEHALPVSVAQLHLVAPVVDTLECPGVGDFTIDVATWSGFKTQIGVVHLWHSVDDTSVPIHHSERFQEKMPAAVLHRFTDRGHFLQPDFPELTAVIKTATF